MRQQWLLKYLLAGLYVSVMALPVWACEKPSSLERPQCEASELQFGMCFNSQMDEAVHTSEHPYFEGRFEQIVAQAQAHLDTMTPAPNKVIITDLDETLVSNAQYYRQNKAFHPETWAPWIASNHDGPYLLPVLNLIKAAKGKGYRVMFITGRPADQALATLQQVSDIAWDGVYLRPAGIPVPSSQYKAQVRQMLRTMGYDIVLNLGDQPSDFDAPIRPEDGEFLLPNVMYRIP